jgi:hypothetical protein
MTNLEFRCWIKGFVELSEQTTIDAQQLEIIRNHANLVRAIDGQVDADIEEFIKSQ